MAIPISYNVRNVIVRWKVTLLALAGISLVVGVLIALTAMANGFSKALAATGSADNAIITQRGSASELSSGMSRDNASMIMVDSRVKRDAQGRPMASPEMIIVAALPKRGEITEVNVTVRGVTQMAFSVRQNVKITEGRNFTPGLYEVVVGKKAADRYQGLEVGGSIKLQRKTWQVVGIFTSEGSGFESEIWGDYDALAPVFNRSNGYQSLTVRLGDPSTLEAFNTELKANPNMQLQMASELQYLRGTGGPDRQCPDRAGLVRGRHHGYRRGVRGNEHDVRAGVGPHARDRHAARAGLFANVHPQLVHDRVGISRAGGWIAWQRPRAAHQHAVGRHGRRKLLTGRL